MPEEYFIRVQKSFIITINKITALDGNRVILKNISSEILIGETHSNISWKQSKKADYIIVRKPTNLPQSFLPAFNYGTDLLQD
ncbi:LytTR family transcriptional regulator DNA-binding domain-containing protein [Pedobacter sp. ISL-64]|uniref:LytTR family transcriptional regulator DNA-binding domain-containing protein n=1 Tax=unclassified Pedobacter TaxID=2628915 RepID=UPI00397A56E5